MNANLCSTSHRRLKEIRWPRDKGNVTMSVDSHSELTGHSAAAVRVGIGSIEICGDLVLPLSTEGIVLFAHGSGSSRFSPRNRFVARTLQKAGWGTLLLDLLTEEEEAIDARTRALRFNVDLLASRLHGATDWLSRDSTTAKLTVGYFGASTGAAAALIAAAELDTRIRAVVCRGGRPDLANRALDKVNSPTLLIVGQNDEGVIDLNQQALTRLHASVKSLAVVPGATHLFEEPGTLEYVSELATDWFDRYLPKESSSA